MLLACENGHIEWQTYIYACHYIYKGEVRNNIIVEPSKIYAVN